MHAKPVGPRGQSLPLTILLMATSLPLFTCSVTCGQENQDLAKRKQVEGPLLNVLKPNQANADSALKEEPNQDPFRMPIPFAPKSAIERPTEAMLKTLALPFGLDRNFNFPGPDDTVPLDSLFVGKDGKQTAKPVPVTPPADGAFSKSIIEMPPKLLLGIPSNQAAGQPESPKTNAKPKRKNEPTTVSTPKRDNPTVQPGRVNWHADLATATKQSKRSGKPVFHFQLLGQLDQRFT